MAQTAHAATAVLERYKDTSEVKSYLADLENMRKVVMEVNPMPAPSLVTERHASVADKSRLQMKRRWQRWRKS